MIQPAPKLDRSAVQRLLAAAGGSGPGVNADVQTQPYDYHSPLRFVGQGRQDAMQAASRLAGAISAALSARLGQAATASVQAFSEHFASRLDICGQHDYWLTLCDEAGNWQGAVVIAAQAATQWVGTMLGSGADDQADRQLSHLEQSLLADAAEAVVAGIAQVAGDGQAGRLKSASALARGGLNLGCQSSEELCRIALGLCQGDQADVTLILASQWLGRLAGLRSAAATSASKPADNKIHLVGHLEKAAVTVEAWLGSATLTVSEAMSLEPGDVLVLDQRLDQSGPLLVQGQCVAMGLPVQSDGQYALKITAKGTIRK